MEKVRIALRVKPKINKRMQKLADKENWSKARLAEISVERYLDLRKVEA